MNTVRGIAAATAASPTARSVAVGPLVERNPGNGFRFPLPPWMFVKIWIIDDSRVEHCGELGKQTKE